MDSPRFLLYGIGGTYNYGCEAIVRGTVHILRHAWPHASIRYATPRCGDDIRRLKGCEVDIVPRPARRYSLNTALRKASDVLGLDWSPVSREDVHLARECDVVLMIGGDLYTPGPNGKTWPKALVSFGNRARRMGKRLAVWGASIGPFLPDTHAARSVAHHLRRADLIVSRESCCNEYLSSIGIDHNVVCCADPAYVLPPSPSSLRNRNRMRIGVNLSPLSLAYSRMGSGRSAGIRQAEAVAALVKTYDADVILIPHVHCNFTSTDDDITHLRQIYELLPAGVKTRVQVHGEDSGFLGLKPVLASCDMVIAARMHCAINALSQRVPTMFVGYSHKSLGMCRYVYGHDKWHVTLETLCSPRFPSVVASFAAQRAHIGQYLEGRVRELRASAYDAATALQSVLSGTAALPAAC